jgi:hypothetical protein
MILRVMALILAGSMMTAGTLRAQQGRTAAALTVKTTYVALAQNANAILMEPATTDPDRSRIAILIAHPEHITSP